MYAGAPLALRGSMWMRGRGLTASLIAVVCPAIFADKVEYALIDRLGAPRGCERGQLKQRDRGAQTFHSSLSRQRGQTVWERHIS